MTRATDRQALADESEVIRSALATALTDPDDVTTPVDLRRQRADIGQQILEFDRETERLEQVAEAQALE